MSLYQIPLAEVFAYIADAGYIAHAEKTALMHATGTKNGQAKHGGAKLPLYRKCKLQENEYNQKGKLVGKHTIRTLLLPKLSAQD